MRFPIVCAEDGSAVLGECALCGGELYRGQICYDINGERICQDCLADYARQAFGGFAVRLGEEARA